MKITLSELGKVTISALIFEFIVIIMASCVYATPVKIDLKRIIQIESSGNPNAVNHNSGAIGLCQITIPALQDYNYYHKTNYVWHNLFSAELNSTISEWYLNERIPAMLRSYKIPVTVKNILICYNWGIGNCRKWHKNGSVESELPSETRVYLKKYQKN